MRPRIASQVTEKWVAWNDSVGPRAIAVDRTGITVAGIYRGSSGFIALLKYDTAGVQQWMRIPVSATISMTPPPSPSTRETSFSPGTATAVGSDSR